ncbi:MAG: hypothetical protein RL701_6303 [Pseudomonadota bacterium]|jgi:geranylgeranyl diphosphate synthase type II
MTTAQQLVERVLAEDQALVQAALRAAIPDAEPRRYLYDLVEIYPNRGSKGFRASLCLATCRAFGGQTEDALEAAVALEFLHNAFLVHDDIEDGSMLRRGAPTLHQAHGIALALNAGDGLCALALAALARSAGRQTPKIGALLLAELAHLFRRSVEGQAWELGWIAEQRFDITEADYLRMVLAKTCWYSTIHPCRLGALIGSQGSAALDALVPFGLYLGAAFQIRDDIDNLAPGDSAYGKDVGGDIIEGKRSIPLIHLLAHSAETQRAEIVQLISSKTSPVARPERVERVVHLMMECGSLEYARDVADKFASMAIAEIPKAFAGARVSSQVDYIYAIVLYLCGAINTRAGEPMCSAQSAGKSWA